MTILGLTIEYRRTVDWGLGFTVVPPFNEHGQHLPRQLHIKLLSLHLTIYR